MKIKRLYVIGIPDHEDIMEYGSRYRFFTKWSAENATEVKYLKSDQQNFRQNLINDLIDFRPDSIFIYRNDPIEIFDVLAEHKNGARVIFWHCDWASLKDRWGSYYRKNSIVDYLFVTSFGHVQGYKTDLDITVSFLPNEFANDFDSPVFDEAFKSEVAFVGQCAPFVSEKYYDDRKKFVQYLFAQNCPLRMFPDMSDVSEKNYPVEYNKRLWQNQTVGLARMYGSGKIFLGIHTKQVDDTFCYFSNRPFITMGYGAFYLCYKSAGIENIFGIKKHIDVFSTFEEGREKILFYLAHDDLRKQIAANARALIFEKHLTEHRLRDLIATVETETPTFSGWL
jgi:spore maturation protein CgeB